MRFIHRKLVLFPAIALTASAQQPSPEAAAAEAALRARAQQFFDLQVAKKYRPAEALVAEDSKEEYYNGNRYSFRTYTIQKVELLDNNTHAKVTIRAKVLVMVPGFPAMDMDNPMTTLWKVEDGQWVWYVNTAAGVETPFGNIKRVDPAAAAAVPFPATIPDAAALQASVKIDRNAVSLTPDAPHQTVTISNELPGPVDLQISSAKIAGLSIELEKKHLDGGGKTPIHFRATGEGKGTGIVHVIVSPIGTQLNIRVTVN